MRRTEHINAFVQTIWDWYAEHKRALPWRDLRDTDPTERAYKVMVSEIMLQQTQVPRVKIVFKYFLERFPQLQDLAAASNREVLLAWRGMGYNSRALRLRDAAQTIVACGSFPQEMEALQKIPGIGQYTAAAIRNFAFNIPTPCLDTNIRRILHRTFVGPENLDGTWKKDDQYLLKLAEEVLSSALSSSDKRNDAANWHAALMDFGSLVQTKKSPQWELCPLTRKGLMKTTPAQFKKISKGTPNVGSKEPGRFVGTKYIPNRIFRGKVVEELRDAERGLTLESIGKRVCLDWSPEHRKWLETLLQKLIADRMVAKAQNRFTLS